MRMIKLYKEVLLNSVQDGKRVLVLDILRFVALCMVVLFHADVRSYTVSQSFPVTISFGDLGVSIFIVLSGLSLSEIR